jgi:hypothetical protein
MSIGPEAIPFRQEPEPMHGEISGRRIYEDAGVHIMVLTDYQLPENDEKRYTALVLSQDEIDYLHRPNPDAVVTYSNDLNGAKPSFSTLTEEIGLPMGWIAGNPMRVSAATEEKAIELAVAAWVGCITAPEPTPRALQ